jgi:hypothetical protein
MQYKTIEELLASGQNQGANASATKSKQFATIEELLGKEAPVFQVPQKEEGRLSSFLSGVKEKIGERVKDYKSVVSDVGKEIKFGDSNLAETPEGAGARLALRTGGAVAGGVSDVIIEGLKALAGKKVSKTASKAIEYIGEKVASTETAKKLSGWAEKNPESAQDLSDIFDISMALPIGAGAKVAKESALATKNAFKMAGKAADKSIDKAIDFTGKQLVKSADNISENFASAKTKVKELAASEPSEQLKTVLKGSTEKDLDDFLSIAEKHSKDLNAKTGFDVVGDKMADAAKQIQKRLNGLARQKEEIISKASRGLDDFSIPTRKTVLELVRLKNSASDEAKNIVRNSIEKLKNVKNKMQADRAIDEIQSLVEEAGATLTLKKGGKIEKQISGIIGKYNSQLKKSLPESYQKINKELSEGNNYLKSLNKGLSENLGGVPIRGASLTKQYFSPFSSKTKSLFEYIKKTTNIDLAKDATLAKFSEELYKNPTVRSLLTGIPTTKSGLMNLLENTALEKSGLNKGLQKIIQEETIKKTKQFIGKGLQNLKSSK